MFYVSAERVRPLDLAGVPVGVFGNQGACVIAKSYEMKAAGVKTGVPIWEALRLCPDGPYVSATPASRSHGRGRVPGKRERSRSRFA